MNDPTRRRTLRIGLAALTAGAATPVVVEAALSSPDATLIALCAAWEAAGKEAEAFADTRTTLDIERQTQVAFEALQDRQLEIADEIADHLPPRTTEGARAIAKTALNAAYLRQGYFNMVEDICASMAWESLAFLTGNPPLQI